MEVTAIARHIRMSPRKVRLVADLVRGLDVDKAAAQLRFIQKAAAKPVLKVILSAAANAEHNFKRPAGGLYVKTIRVDGGPTLKRWRARAFGRAGSIRKRSCHIWVGLDSRGIVGTPDAAAAAAVVPTDATKKVTAKRGAKKAAATK
jgi:large subunit ribosomal protein L22